MTEKEDGDDEDDDDDMYCRVVEQFGSSSTSDETFTELQRGLYRGSVGVTTQPLLSLHLTTVRHDSSSRTCPLMPLPSPHDSGGSGLSDVSRINCHGRK